MVEGEQRGTVWPEDVPEDVLTGGGPTGVDEPEPAGISTASTPSTGVTIEEPKRRGHLKLVE
jgi:hypothetical protein